MSSYLSHRIQSSPSVTLEKGSYRIRAISRPSNPFPLSSTSSSSSSSHVHTPPSSRRDSRATSKNFIFHKKRLVLLVMALTLATIACFGAAYYLFTTSRWASTLVLRPQSTVDSPSLQVVIHNDSLLLPSLDWKADGAVVGGERFLSYLPHSGFHNQRIALENALVLSRLLNRTLLVPPIRLGRKAISYDNFTLLQAIVGDEFLPSPCPQGHRRDLVFNRGCIPEDETSVHTYLPWDWLTDFAKIRLQHKVVERWNLSSEWIYSDLGIPSGEILTIPDTTVYHYQFAEDAKKLKPHVARGPSYLESVDISSLLAHPSKLIQLGSLFGSSRLKLHLEDTRAMRKEVRRNMVFTQPILADISDRIHDALGGYYLGAHIRLNDWFFRRSAESNTRLIWWNLVHGILNLTLTEAEQLEAKYARYKIPDSPPALSMTKSHPLPSFALVNSSSSPPQPSKRCRGKRHTKSSLLPLNIPLFISTDTKDPTKNRHLSLIRHTFPCVFFLQDFAEDLEAMKRLENPVDNFNLSGFMVPFVDAMVAAKAKRVVGTGHSTFSWFVQDVLWRRYNSLDIKERGGGR